jgi:3-carboxy-cis,cis-muconate cycloisomerase
MKHTADLLAGLEVHEDAMQKNLGVTRGAIVSEAVMMGLGKTLGRSYAHDLVYDLCRDALKQDKPLLELLTENEEVSGKLTREELESLCDPANYLGYSVEMVDRVLKQTTEQRSEQNEEIPMGYTEYE